MALTAQHDREVRIAAPLAFVWNEVSDLDRMLAYFREVNSYDVAPDGRRATIIGAHCGLDVTGHLKGTEFFVLKSVSFRIDVPQLQLVYHGTFRLAAEGEIATSLRYLAHVECRHPGVQRRRQETRTRMYRHVIDLTDRVTSFSERHPVVRKTRERLTAKPPVGTTLREQSRRNPCDVTQVSGSGAGPQLFTAPDVRARREAPWVDAAQARLQSRLRRLVEESDPDERRTPAWARLDQLHRSLRYPFAKPPA